MSRTHTQVSYGFRSIGITTFVIAASFFANTASALAEYSTSSPTAPGYSQYANSRNGMSQNPSGSGYSGGSMGQYSNYRTGVGPNSSGVGHGGGDMGNDTDSQTATDTASTLQARIAQLDAMKARLQTLLESLKQRSTLSHQPVCPLVARLAGVTIATSSNDVLSHCRQNPMRPLPPVICTTSNGCHPIWSTGNSTSTLHRKNCVNNDPRRCSDSFGGMSTSSLNRYTPVSGGMFGGGSNGPLPSASGTGTGVVSSSSVGIVHGASSDMSAEMADVLSGLHSDLLDLRDALDQ